MSKLLNQERHADRSRQPCPAHAPDAPIIPVPDPQSVEVPEPPVRVVPLDAELSCPDAAASDDDWIGGDLPGIRLTPEPETRPPLTGRTWGWFAAYLAVFAGALWVTPIEGPSFAWNTTARPIARRPVSARMSPLAAAPAPRPKPSSKPAAAVTPAPAPRIDKPRHVVPTTPYVGQTVPLPPALPQPMRPSADRSTDYTATVRTAQLTTWPPAESPGPVGLWPMCDVTSKLATATAPSDQAPAPFSNPPRSIRRHPDTGLSEDLFRAAKL